MEEQTFPTGDEDLLNVSELVAQDGPVDNCLDIATARTDNITLTSRRESSNISPNPSTSRKVKLMFIS